MVGEAKGGEGLTVCCMSRRGGGEDGRLDGWLAGGGGKGEGREGSIAAGVCRKGVQTTCHWV